MKIKALLTTLAIVGSSSVAMARPVSHTTSAATVTASARASFNVNYGPTIRDHRTTVDRYAVGRDYNEPRNEYGQRFATLATDLQFGSAEYRKDIMPGAGQFSKLRIDAEQGRTYLMKIVVEFADGTSQQQINLDKTLIAGDSLTLDLTGSTHSISRVLVYRADGSVLDHMGERNGRFTVSAK